MKPKLLIILQNFYGNRSSRFKIPVYTTRIINRSNATYSRIVPHLEPHFELFFTECTSIIATNKDDKFPTDLPWVKSALDYDNWHAVIAFGAQAHQAMNDLEFQPFAKLHHPVSWAWRRAHIEETVSKLLGTIEKTSI